MQVIEAGVLANTRSGGFYTAESGTTSHFASGTLKRAATDTA